jgi:hypothetical protein
MSLLCFSVSVFVIMTTRSPAEVLYTSLNDGVLYRRGRIVQIFSRQTTIHQLGRSIGLLIPLHGEDRCSTMLKHNFRRYILVTTQEPRRGLLMFHEHDKLFKYSSHFVKRMQEYLYVRGGKRKIMKW